MLDKLMNNPYAWVVLSIISIVSFAYAIISNYKSKEKKEFSYIQKSHSLIHKKKSKFKKLSITYGEQKIEDLCISRFTIWNSGNKTLDSNDMVASRELTIKTLSDNVILDTEVIAYSEETNCFFIEKKDEHTAKINFDYVDRKEGVVVQIIHTGTPKDLNLDCKIKGGKPVKNIVKEKAHGKIIKAKNIDKLEKFFIGIVCALISIIFIAAVISTISIFNTDIQNIIFNTHIETYGNEMQKSTAIITSIFLFLYTFVFYIMYRPIIMKTFGIGIPKSLKKYSNFMD